MQAAPRIVFVIMSAVDKACVVDQLARALAPHTVLVHHDFSQTTPFVLSAPNARFVPNPRRTGWGVFGFTEGVFHSLRHALDNEPFDYLQMLSPTCLPIKPMRQFEAHVAGPAEAHFDCIDLLEDCDALMSVGYRAFTPEHSLRHRALRRMSVNYFGPAAGRRDEAGVWLRSGPGRGALAWVAPRVIKAVAHPAVGRHIFGRILHPYYGSPWFGARRQVVADMVDLFQRPEVRAWYSRLRIADEFLVGTLLMHLRARKGPMNHLIQHYDEAHVGNFSEADVTRLRSSPAFFARKFPGDASAPLRLKVLRELAAHHPEPLQHPFYEPAERAMT